MKKTQYIELLKTIKKTMVSFVSICFFVLLGAAIFLGMDWSVTGFKNTVNNTLDEWNMHDVSLTYPYGFTSEEVDKIKELDYVDAVEGQNSLEARFLYNNTRYQAKIILLTNQIDDAHKILGELPKKKGEIGFERYWAETNGINIGDIIVFEHDDDGTAYSLYNLINEDLDALQENSITEDGMLHLTTDIFKVTGLFENATYVNQHKVTYGVSATTSIPNDCIAYVSEDSIDNKSFNGYQTVILTSPELRGLNTFEDEYKNKNNDIVEKLQNDLSKYINDTNTKILSAVDNVKDDIDKQIEDGEKQLEKAQKDIINGEKQIKDGEKQLAEGKEELASARIELDNGWKEYYAGLAQYNASKAEFDKLVGVYDGIMTAIKVYKLLEDVPSIVDGYYDNYIVVESAVKTILESSTTEAKTLIKQFFLDYKNNVYDNDVIGLATALKEIVDADGYADLKNELLSISSPDASVTALLEFINYIEEIDSGIDEAINTYHLLKNENISKILEDSAITITEQQKTKIVDVFNYISTNIDAAYTDASKYAVILNAILTEYDPVINNVKDELETNIKPQIDSGKAQLASGKAQLDAGYAKLIDGENQYEDGLAQIEANEKLIKKSKKEIINGKEKLEEGRKDLEIAKNKAKDFDEKLNQIENYDITTLGRNLNGGVGSTVVPIDMMSSIKYTMVLLFIIVGVFVCYSALSRSVYDQTIQIGTKKALGLSRKEITISFLLYGSFATIVGCFFGVIAARFIVEPLILNILAKNYTVADSQYYFSLKSSLLFLLFELTVTNITSFLACNKALKKKAIKLLQGPEDLIGKSHFYEKLPGWNSLSLLTKTIINNCVNDSRRVLSTLVGVAGCCSLMVCAICLITNMNDSLDYQLNNIAKFETITYIDTSVDDVYKNIDKKLNEMGLEHLPTTYSSCAIENSKGDYVSGAMFVYDDDKFFDFFDIAIDGVRQDVGDGICVAKAYAQFNDVKVGDYVTIIDSIGEKHDIKVAAIFDYYLLRVQTIMSKQSYINVFGEEPIKSSVLIKTNGYTNEEINDNLYSIDGYISSFDYLKDSNEIYASLTDSVMIVVITFFVLAVVLAFLVLLNLLIMFVDEKKKELIVMMINGYSRRSVKRYIYGDTIVLTIIGILIGTIIGVTVGFATIKTFDSDCVTIMRNINIPSYLICGALTALLSAISCLIALRKVDRFKLTEINSK